MSSRPDPSSTANLHVALTDRYLRALRAVPSARDIRDTVQRGLIARVLPSGIVHFSIRYRYHRVPRRLKLGEYPAVSLREARTRASRPE